MESPEPGSPGEYEEDILYPCKGCGEVNTNLEWHNEASGLYGLLRLVYRYWKRARPLNLVWALKFSVISGLCAWTICAHNHPSDALYKGTFYANTALI